MGWSLCQMLGVSISVNVRKGLVEHRKKLATVMSLSFSWAAATLVFLFMIWRLLLWLVVFFDVVVAGARDSSLEKRLQWLT